MVPVHLTLSFKVICNLTVTHLSLQESSLWTQWPTHTSGNLKLFHLSVCSHSLPGLVSPSALGISPILQAQVTPQFLHEAFLALIPAPPEALCTLCVVVAILSVVVVLTQKHGPRRAEAMLRSSLHPHGFQHSRSSVCPCRMPAFWPPSWEMETTNTLHSLGKATPAFTYLRAKGTSYREEGQGNTQATHSLELANSEAFPHGCLSSTHC